ncbi:V-set and transmembrane domain-containing protein 2-like protein, partial [Clarias magur]
MRTVGVENPTRKNTITGSTVSSFKALCFLQTLFTEVPHDMTAHSGQDVEMACSFRGSGSTSYSLEIQWWYIRNHKEWTDKETWTTNQVAPQEEMSKDATKIS